MTIDELIKILEDARKEARSGDLQIYVNTEAKAFQTHIVPVLTSSVISSLEQGLTGSPKILVLQLDSRRGTYNWESRDERA